jgi:hypothetical protein
MSPQVCSQPRQLVEAEAAKDASHGRNARIVAHLEDRTIQIIERQVRLSVARHCSHGPKLVERELSSASPQRTCGQYIAGRCDPDRRGNRNEQGDNSTSEQAAIAMSAIRFREAAAHFPVRSTG